LIEDEKNNKNYPRNIMMTMTMR